MHFADDLISACEEKNSIAVVGLDPRFDLLPGQLQEKAALQGLSRQSIADVFVEFCTGIIDAVHTQCPAVKLQIAFFEQLGWEGYKAYWDVAQHARGKKLIVIGDIKRGDIASTAQAYAAGHLGWPLVDKALKTESFVHAVTLNPYLGSDAVEPFLQACKIKGSGLFMLAKTSNPSSVEIQDISAGNRKIYDRVSMLINKWGEDLVGSRGYSSVGAVVGATFPEEIKRLREWMPKAIFLIPGYGAQGGKAADIVQALNHDGHGAVVASSRGVIFAHTQKPGLSWQDAAAEALQAMNDDLNRAFRERHTS